MPRRSLLAALSQRFVVLFVARFLASFTARAVALFIAFFAAFFTAFLATPAPANDAWGEGGLRIAWRADAGRAVEFPVIASESTLFVATTDPKVLAYDLEQGRRLWGKRMKQTITAPPAIAAGRVFVALGDGEPRLRALDEQQGRTLWTHDLKVESIAIAANGSVAVALGENGRIEALDTGDGHRVWKREGLGPIAVGMVERAGTLYVAARRDSVLALDATSGRLIWSAVVPGRRAAPPALMDAPPRLVLFDAEGDEAQLDLATGELLLRRRRSALQLVAPISAGQWVVSLSSGGRVEGFVAEERESRWSIELGATPAGAAVSEGHELFLLRQTGRLSAVRLDRGEDAWSLELPGDFLVPPLITRTRLILVDDRGELYVYGRDHDS